MSQLRDDFLSKAAASDIVAACLELSSAGLVVGSVGNVSARIADDILITPTCLSYGRMGAGDLVRLTPGEGVTTGIVPGPSRELPLHLAIYDARPDVGAVVHTHGPHGVAWSFLGAPLAPHIEEQACFELGDVNVSAPAAAASPELGMRAVLALSASNAALLGRHGVVTVGTTVSEAVDRACAVDHHAQIAWLLRSATSPR